MQQKKCLTFLFAIIITFVLFIGQEVADGNPINLIPDGPVMPDFTTKPPVITFGLSDHVTLNTANTSFPITVKVGNSETAHQKQLSEVSYKCDWQTNYTVLYEYKPATMNGSIPLSSHLSEFSTSIYLTNIPEGNHTMIVLAEEIGNYLRSKDGRIYGYSFKTSESSTLNFSIDTIPPTINLSIDNKTYYSADLPLNVSTDENLTVITYNIDNQGNISLSSNTTLSSLKPGEHALTIYVTDKSSITSTKTVSFIIAEAFPTTTAIIGLITICVVVFLMAILIRKRGSFPQR